MPDLLAVLRDEGDLRHAEQRCCFPARASRSARPVRSPPWACAPGLRGHLLAGPCLTHPQVVAAPASGCPLFSLASSSGQSHHHPLALSRASISPFHSHCTDRSRFAARGVLCPHGLEPPSPSRCSEAEGRCQHGCRAPHLLSPQSSVLAPLARSACSAPCVPPLPSCTLVLWPSALPAWRASQPLLTARSLGL